MAVRAFLAKLQIDDDVTTDPVLIRDVLAQDMKLDDLHEIADLLNPLLREAQSLAPLVRSVTSAISEKHPAIEEFLRAALANELIPDISDRGRHIILRMLHHIAILEQLTKALALDNGLMEKVHGHLMQKRQALGIRDGILSSFIDIFRATGGIFEPLKAKSVDLVASGIIAIRKAGTLAAGNVKKRKIALAVNILEAASTDMLSGYRKNGFVGLKLAKRPYTKSWMGDEPGEIMNNSSREWVSLYQTWNLAFVTGNLDFLNLFYPKLLIPQVIDSPPETYMHRRVVALWLTVSFYLFAKLEQKPSPVLANQRQLALVWGEINSRKIDRHLPGASG